MYILGTGQDACYDEKGQLISCTGTGQDGEYRLGIKPLRRRFQDLEGGIVQDILTGLVWSKDANVNGFPLGWQEALDLVKELNQQAWLGFSDWRMPNRRELRSILDLNAKNPALESGHPFENVFSGWYWSSTTAAINYGYAWYVHLAGARMFYGKKDQECLLWPVRGISKVIPKTGQSACYDRQGRKQPCAGTGQDGALQLGEAWTEPRFQVRKEAVLDLLTGLMWSRDADLAKGMVTWQEALDLIKELNQEGRLVFSDWRLPNINELESLVDCSRHSPALSHGHPFYHVREFYWSSTTSFYDPPWAWALYMKKGATGVGLKDLKNFYVWAARG